MARRLALRMPYARIPRSALPPGPFRLHFGRNVTDAVADADHIRRLELRSVHQFKRLLPPRLEDRLPVENENGAGLSPRPVWTRLSETDRAAFRSGRRNGSRPDRPLLQPRD